MGKGRAPCCDKSKVKKGPWSPAEDLRLITFIQKFGHDNWRALPKQAGLLRCGKSCRLRWINYLRPDVKRGNFTKEEEDSIIKLHQSLGNKWSKIASQLPGRTDNEIKNVWNTHLKKKLALENAKGKEDHEWHKSIASSSPSSSSSFSSVSELDNQEKLLDKNFTSHSTQSNGRSMTRKSRITKNVVHDSQEQIKATHDEQPKESSHSSISSPGSNVTNSSRVHDDLSNPEDLIGSILDFNEPCNNIYDILEEVNKPEIQNLPMNIEVPLESDLEFWDMLDSLSSFQSNEMQSQNNNGASPSSNSDCTRSEEVDVMKWMRYLENELGLDNIREGSHENIEKDAYKELPLVHETFQYDQMQLSPDGIDFYHSNWPYF